MNTDLDTLIQCALIILSAILMTWHPKPKKSVQEYHEAKDFNISNCGKGLMTITNNK